MARPLQGPWLRIAQRITQGHNTIWALKECCPHARERKQVSGNVDKMLELGFLETRYGKLLVSELGKGLM